MKSLDKAFIVTASIAASAYLATHRFSEWALAFFVLTVAVIIFYEAEWK